MVWNTWLCLARWGQPPPPSCAPSWSPVKINPVLAKPRTVADPAHPPAVGRGSVAERWPRRKAAALGAESQQQAGLWEGRAVAFAGI